MRKRPQPPERRPAMTRNRLIAMYRQYPEALIEELEMLMIPVTNDAERAAQNYALARLGRLPLHRDVLMRAMARGIIEAIRSSDDGQTQNDGTQAGT